MAAAKALQAVDAVEKSYKWNISNDMETIIIMGTSSLLLTGTTVLEAWTVTGWLKRIRLQKVSQLDLQINSLLKCLTNNYVLLNRTYLFIELVKSPL